MPELTAKKSEVFQPDIPENEVFDARMGEIEVREFIWDNEPRVKFLWHFTITQDGPHKGKEIIGESSDSFVAHPNCKAYNWVAAITGRAYEPNEKLNTDDLMGMPVRVITYWKKQPSKKDPTREFVNVRVKDLLPARGVAMPKISVDGPATGNSEDNPF